MPSGFFPPLLHQPFRDAERDRLHLGHEPVELTTVGDPLLEQARLLPREADRHGLAAHLPGPLIVRPVEFGRRGLAATAGLAARHEAADEAAAAGTGPGGG